MYERERECPICRGRGYAGCLTCFAVGWVVKKGPFSSRPPFSHESRYTTDSETCRTCNGARGMPCTSCRGTGYV
jgi:hypothetical protein